MRNLHTMLSLDRLQRTRMDFQFTCYKSHIKVYKSVFFRIFTETCKSHNFLILEHFRHPKEKPLREQSLPCPLPTAAPAASDVLCLWIWPVLTSVLMFHTLTVWPPGSSVMSLRSVHVAWMLWRSALRSFSRLLILHCMDSATFCLSVFQSVNIWKTHTFWPLWIMQLWSFVCRVFCGSVSVL